MAQSNNPIMNNKVISFHVELVMAHADTDASLLHGVYHLMRKHLLSLCTLRIILAFVEMNIAAHGVSACADGFVCFD
jgi:hypothetical protein